MGGNIRIIWPSVKWVSKEDIQRMYEDALANQEDIEIGLTDPMEQAKALDDAGIITLGNQRLPR